MCYANIYLELNRTSQKPVTLCNRELIVRMQRRRRQIFEESCHTSCSTAGPLIAGTWSALRNGYSVSDGSYSFLNPLTIKYNWNVASQVFVIFRYTIWSVPWLPCNTSYLSPCLFEVLSCLVSGDGIPFILSLWLFFSVPIMGFSFFVSESLVLQGFVFDFLFHMCSPWRITPTVSAIPLYLQLPNFFLLISLLSSRLTNPTAICVFCLNVSETV